jgi:hypothetical protein
VVLLIKSLLLKKSSVSKKSRAILGPILIITKLRNLYNQWSVYYLLLKNLNLKLGKEVKQNGSWPLTRSVYYRNSSPRKWHSAGDKCPRKTLGAYCSNGLVSNTFATYWYGDDCPRPAMIRGIKRTAIVSARAISRAMSTSASASIIGNQSGRL